MRPRWRIVSGVALVAAVASCGGASTTGSRHTDIADGRSSDPLPSAPAHDSARQPPPAAAPEPVTGSAADAPEISRSVGEKRGVVVLWPRIVLPRGGPPEPDAPARAAAADVQRALADAARRALPGRPVDVRPEPERVCPRSGCLGVSVGAVVARAGQRGCTVIAWASEAGPSAQRLVPWVGQVELSRGTVPFRDPPEAAARFKDFGSCDGLTEALGEGAASVEAVIAAAER